MTIDLDGGNLWRVPLVSGHPAGLDYGSRGRLIISENSTTYLVDVGKGVQKLSKPAPIAETDAGPCKFYPHQNRSHAMLALVRGGGRYTLFEEAGASWGRVLAGDTGEGED